MSTDLHRRLLVRCDPAWFGLRDNPPKVFAALRAVVELHAPFRRSMLTAACRACSTPVHTQPGRYATVTNWPCSTIRVIADALGVAVDDQELIEKEERHG